MKVPERLEALFDAVAAYPKLSAEEIQQKAREILAARGGEETKRRGNESEARAAILFYQFNEVLEVELASSSHHGVGSDLFVHCVRLQQGEDGWETHEEIIPVEVKSSWRGVKKAREKFAQAGIKRLVLHAGPLRSDRAILREIKNRLSRDWGVNVTRRVSTKP